MPLRPLQSPTPNQRNPKGSGRKISGFEVWNVKGGSRSGMSKGVRGLEFPRGLMNLPLNFAWSCQKLADSTCADSSTQGLKPH